MNRAPEPQAPPRASSAPRLDHALLVLLFGALVFALAVGSAGAH